MSVESDKKKRKVITLDTKLDIIKWFDNGQSNARPHLFKRRLTNIFLASSISIFTRFVAHFFNKCFLAYLLFIILYISVYTVKTSFKCQN
jgi:hypothetical protein